MSEKDSTCRNFLAGSQRGIEEAARKAHGGTPREDNGRVAAGNELLHFVEITVGGRVFMEDELGEAQIRSAGRLHRVQPFRKSRYRQVARVVPVAKRRAQARQPERAAEVVQGRAQVPF